MAGDAQAQPFLIRILLQRGILRSLLAVIAILLIASIGFAVWHRPAPKLRNKNQEAWEYATGQIAKELRRPPTSMAPNTVEFPRYTPKFVVFRGEGTGDSRGIEEFVVSAFMNATYRDLNDVVTRYSFTAVAQHSQTSAGEWKLKSIKIPRGYYINPDETRLDTEIPTPGLIVFRDTLPLAGDAQIAVTASNNFTNNRYSADLQLYTRIGNEGTLAVKLAETANALKVRIIAIPEDEGGSVPTRTDGRKLRIPVDSVWWVCKRDVYEYRTGATTRPNNPQNPDGSLRYLPGTDGPVAR